MCVTQEWIKLLYYKAGREFCGERRNVPDRVDKGLDSSLALVVPPSHQRWLMLICAIVVLAISVIAAPFAGTRLAEADGFIPATESLVFICDVLTASLLLTHSRIIGAPSLLVLGSGYLFSGFIVLPHALSFPGAFAPLGLLGAGFQQTGWLFIAWHFALPAAVIGYVRLEDVRHPISRAAIGYTAAGIAALALVVTLATAYWSHLLPALFVDKIGFTPLANYVTAFDFVLALVALAAILTRCNRSLVAGWTTVAVVAMVAELAIVTFFLGGRFSLGFYLSRSLSVIVSVVVLMALLGQIVGQDLRLARMNTALQFERSRRLTTIDAAVAAIAHELRQPLTSIAMNAQTAELLLQRERASNDAALDETVKDIAAEAFRAGEVLASIRDLFRPAPEHSGPLNVNDIVAQVLRIFRERVHHQLVTLDVRLDTNLPSVIGHKTQLQEVVFNLVQNALDALDDVAENRRWVSVRTEHRSNQIALIVDDGGPGIPPEQQSRIFELFTTTKKNGMGIGLAICRMIVERHGGELRVSCRKKRTRFEMVLPTDRTNVAEREPLGSGAARETVGAPALATG